MKIILSRKGFDSGYGKVASPILSGGTMLSMPIPAGNEGSKTKFTDLSYDGQNYRTLLESLGYPKDQGECCHLDPDIREEIRTNPIPDWKPAFGQEKAAQSYLQKCGVGEGDIFLFFGWFKKAKAADKSFYETGNLHAIYGYLQVGKIITDEKEIREQYPWHPHSEGGYDKNNTLYIPSERLIIDRTDFGKGYGTLDYRPDRILTKENLTRAQWIPHPFLMPEYILGCNRKNSSKKDALYYQGQWQEIVFDGDHDPGLIEWVKKILS